MTQVGAPAVLGVKQAAERLGISYRTVIRDIHAGRIQATKTGTGTAGFVIAEAEVDRVAAEGRAK